MGRFLPLINEAFRKRSCQLLCRGLGIIGIIALVLARQKMMQHMVDVVIPLRVVSTRQKRCIIVVVFQHQMDMPAWLHMRAQFGRHHREEVARRQGVHSIEAQAVEAEFVQPIECILDKELAHGPFTQVDRAAPRRLFGRIEELWRIVRQPVPVGPEMIVDDVEEHHQAQFMGLVDQRL